MAPSVRACATAALLALCGVLVAAPAPARADLAAGLAPPPATAAPNVSDLVTDGLDATGTIADEDVVPADTNFDNATTTLDSAAEDFDGSIGDGTSAAVHACTAAAAVAAATAAAAAVLAL